jgi:hypothetical protein
MSHDPHFHDCPNVIAGKPCGGKANRAGPRRIQMRPLR